MQTNSQTDIIPMELNAKQIFSSVFPKFTSLHFM